MNLNRLETLVAGSVAACGGVTLDSLRGEIARTLAPTDELRRAVEMAGPNRGVERPAEDPYPWY